MERNPLAISSSGVAILALLSVFVVPGFKSSVPEDASRSPGTTSSSSLSSPELRIEREAATPETLLTSTLDELLKDSTGENGKPNSEERKDDSAMYRNHVSPLIVSVPDPRNGSLAIYYDQALTALRQAASLYGYVPGRYSLPWENGQTDHAAQSCPKKAQDVPGIMLFRRSSTSRDHQKWLLVLLVAESAVYGVSVPQMATALKVSDNLKEPELPLRVLGPFFSGSADSLSHALKRFQQQSSDTKISVVTGTATRSIESYFDDCKLIDFARTIPRTDQLETWLGEQLQKLHGKDDIPQKLHGNDDIPGIACLSELGTAYGSAVARETQSSKDSPRPPLCGADNTFRFPLHISELRNQHDVDKGAKFKTPASLRHVLDIRPLSERARSRDIPELASDRSLIEDDLTLRQVFGAICVRHPRYLQIAASDPVDAAFLAKKTREYCPELTLITLGYDEIFLHQAHAAAFSGTLVVTPFAPTLESSQLFGTGQPIAFPNSIIQGFFNAASRLIHSSSEHVESPITVGLTCLPEQDHAQRKCFWDAYLSQIAFAGIWPVRTGKIGPVTEGTPWAASPRQKGPRSSLRAARLFALPVLFVALVHLFCRLTRRSLFAPRARFISDAAARRVFVADLSQAVIVALACIPFWFRERVTGQSNGGVTMNVIVVWIGGAFEALLCCTATFSLVTVMSRTCRSARETVRCWAQRRHPGSSPSSRYYPRPLGVAIGVVGYCGFGFFAVCVAIWIRSLYRDNSIGDKSDLLVANQLLHPMAISPATPLLYLGIGIYVWALFALLRIARLERFPNRRPISPKESCRPATGNLDALWLELRVPWTNIGARYVTVAVITLGLVLRFYQLQQWPTFAGRSFDFAYMAGWEILALVVAAETVRFLSLSRLLLDVLREVAAEPMIDAYDRIARKISGSFGLQLCARVPAAKDLQISALTCQSLAALGRDIGLAEAIPETRDYIALYAKAEGEVTQAMTALNSTSSSRALHERRVHGAFFAAADLLHCLLVEIWRKRSRSPHLANICEEFEAKDLLPGGNHQSTPTPLILMAAVPRELYLWTRIAEDFVAMRISTFFYQVLHELRQTLSFALLGALLLILSVISYPFPTEDSLAFCGWSLGLIVALVALVRLIAFERDEVLSRIGGTKPDHVTWTMSFVRQLALYVVVPLIIVLAGMFPDFGDALTAQLVAIAQKFPQLQGN